MNEYKYCKIFMGLLDASIDRCLTNNGHGTLLRLSLDNFSNYIMMFGNENAEKIVDDLLLHIKALLDEDSIVERIAINELAIVVTNHPPGEVEKYIDEIHRLISKSESIAPNQNLLLKFSSSSITFPSETAKADEAMSKAFLALEDARNRQTSSHCSYAEAENNYTISSGKLRHVKDLQEAINEKRLQFAYQPIIITKTGETYSEECLLRIKDRNGVIHSAGPLIPVAEQMGFIDIIDQKVLELAVKDLKNHPDLHLSINVSSLSTDNPIWLRLCTKLLKDNDVASRLIVEITETSAQKDLRHTAYFVAALQSMGCKVALDDFGAGYTSFRQLKGLSVDIVKIDGAYIRGLTENKENQLFVKTLMDFNRSYGLKTIAECVESGEDAKILMELEVDYLQGFYLGLAENMPEWKKTQTTHIKSGSA